MEAEVKRSAPPFNNSSSEKDDRPSPVPIDQVVNELQGDGDYLEEATTTTPSEQIVEEENYSSETFETESDNEIEAEDDDDVVDEEQEDKQSSEGVISDIKIRCEINIDPSAVQSDSEPDGAKETSSSSPDNHDSQHHHRVANKFVMEEGIRSCTPSDSDYNEESHLFHVGILHESMMNLLLMEGNCKAQQREKRMKYKNGTRLSLSFTNERMREIERHNQILVRKIFQQAPSAHIRVNDFSVCKLSYKFMTYLSA